MLVYVNETIDAFIATHYGEVSKQRHIAIANTFELLWDKYGYRYAEVKTLIKHKP
jgi:hypothetical protein